MLALLQERCESAAAQLMAAEAQLNAAEDVASLRRAGTDMWPCLSSAILLILVAGWLCTDQESSRRQ